MPETAATLPSNAPDKGKLARHMTLFSLVVYGVGDMVGAGIYATIGKAAGQMGNAVWLAFAASMVAAMLTGLSYASIASRYPRAAGAAYVTQRAFRWTFLAYLVGLAVTASGLTSMATSSNAFASAMDELLRWSVPQLGIPVPLIVVGFLAVITLLNLWGIRESLWGNLICTAVEVGGLLFVIALGIQYWGSVDYLQTPRDTVDAAGVRQSGLGTGMILSGAVLTFFAFVGFEDMLNVSEECKDAERTMPWGIMIALGVTTVLYMAVSITAVSTVPYADLAKAGAPFELIAQRVAPWLPDKVYTGITLFAVANTALINYIMGSRLLYGMSRQGLLPRALSRVHATRRTPHVAILTLFVVVLGLAMLGRVQFGAAKVEPVRELASATSLLLLGCFCVVNIALVVLKRRPGEARGQFEIPIVVPILGAVVCAALIVARLLERNTAGEFQWRAPMIAIAVGVVITILYLIMRPQQLPEEEDVDEPAAAGRLAEPKSDAHLN